MTKAYKIIRRNYETIHGKPYDEEHKRIRKKLLKSLEDNNIIFSIADHLYFFEEFGCTLELNDGLICGV